MKQLHSEGQKQRKDHDMIVEDLENLVPLNLQVKNVLQNSKHPSFSLMNNRKICSQSPKPPNGFHQNDKNAHELSGNSQQNFDKMMIHQSKENSNRNNQPQIHQYSSHNPTSSSQIHKKKSITQTTLIQCDKKKNIQGKSKIGASHSKNSQSLANQKVVDIINGLQQSLGVISNNVRNSFNTEEINQMVLQNMVSGNSKKTLVESALLAQKLAQMTLSISSQMPKQKDIKLCDDKNKKQVILKQKAGSYNMSIGSQKGFKTIEDLNDQVSSHIQPSSRVSIEGRPSLGKKVQKTQKGKAHQRTKSELQFSRKQEIGGLMINGQLRKSKDGVSSIGGNCEYSAQGGKKEEEIREKQNNIIGFYYPISTKNQKVNMDYSHCHVLGDQNNKLKKRKSGNVSKCSNVNSNGVLTNQRCSISSSHQTKLSSERLSDANFIAQMNKKCNNLFMNNLSGGFEPHKLKSAASSPSLHCNVKQNIPLKKQVFDFGMKQKKIGKKQKTDGNDKIEEQCSLSSHKRSSSDGTSITKMFHFKQQMMLNKLLNKGNSMQVQTINNSIQDPQSINFSSQVIRNIQFPSSSNHSQALIDQQRLNIVSNLSSKRPSNEISQNQQQIAEINTYNSPRSQMQSKLQAPSAYSEMKQFIEKFQQNSLSQAAANTINVNMKQQQEQMNSNRGDGSTIGSNTTLSSGSGVNKKQSIRASNKFNNPQQQQQQQYKQFIDNQLQDSVRQSHGVYSHKRAKSDLNFHFDLMRGSGGQGKSSLQDSNTRLPSKDSKPLKKEVKTYEMKQDMVILNMNNPLQKDKNMQVLQQAPLLYSARASPRQKQIHQNIDVLKQDNIQSNRSEKSQIVMKLGMTTNKKLSTHRETSPHEFETPQFNYNIYNPTINNYIVNNSAQNDAKKQTQHKNTFKLLVQKAQHNSPKLKILPTPKAVQPGINGQCLLQTNQTSSSTSSKQNQVVMKESQLKSFRNMNERIETMESNVTNGREMSPQAKEKKRIIKMIKVSFNKMSQALKTTGDFYRIGKMLGKGAFGRVNLAIHKLCEQLVAVKSINKQFLSEDESQKKKVMQEVLILQKTRHNNIVKLFDSFESSKHIVFVMELCGGGDLLNYVRKRRKLKEDVAKHIFRQVVNGLNYCHAKGIVHRDIKLDNLLLDSNGNVKICDFGVSKHLSDAQELMTEQCGTPAYIAPEILKDKGYRGFGVDIWSLGVCLYAILYGTVPFKANNMSELHQLILKAKYSLKDDKVEISDDAKSLIKALLEPNPQKRLTIRQVKQHPWLEEDGIEVEIFTEEEIKMIQKDFTYQDMSRYKRNQQTQQKQQMSTEHFFTEHALDSTQNVLLKNCSTKSIVLAPFNSTRSRLQDMSLDDNGEAILPPLDIDPYLILDKRIIKFNARVKDIDRQYELNNNGELDNGVYNKFVKQSTMKDDNNSILNSFQEDRLQAPLVSQNSDEEAEAALAIHNQNQTHSELREIQSFLMTHSTMNNISEEELIIDYDVVEKVEEFGYPQVFIVNSLEQMELNDATTNYYLMEKDKHVNGFSQGKSLIN